MKKYRIVIIFVLLLAIPLISQACPFCQGSGEGAKKVVFAYKSITAFLAIIPIGGMMGILYWLKKTNKQQTTNNNTN